MELDAGSVTLRRTPRQDRSNQRIDLILDTTATLIEEHGFNELSMTLIAKRIGMSGAGIYRYFDGVGAVAGALVTRNLERLVALITVELQDADEPWDVTLRRIITMYSDLCRTEPGFRWMRLGNAVDRNLMDAALSNRTILARMLRDLFSERYEVLPRPDLLEHVEVIVEIVDSVIARAFETNPDGDPFFIDEAGRVVVDYLGAYLERTLADAEAALAQSA